MHKKVLLIDLDGVLNTYTGEYKNNFIPPLAQGARDFLELLSKDFSVKIFTSREIKLTKEWVQNNKLDNLVDEVTNEKVPAWLILDDRALTFNGNYSDIYEKIINFKVWYKN